MAEFNRVTEQQFAGKDLWIVAAEWRGGHNRRVIRLENIFFSNGEALAAWESQTAENHNMKHGLPADYDAGFVRHPLRQYTLKQADTEN